MSQRPPHVRSRSSLSSASGRSIGAAAAQKSVPQSPRPSIVGRPSFGRTASQTSSLLAARALPYTALLIVDVQNDFLPGGSLAVKGSDQILEPIRQLLHVDFIWPMVVLSQDWHPRGHVSFTTSHKYSPTYQDEQGRPYVNLVRTKGTEKRTVKQLLWAPHCITNTPGARVEESIEVRCKAWVKRTLLAYRLAYVHKGTEMQKDAYSAFKGRIDESAEPGQQRSLAEYLRGVGVQRLVICGIAMDVCVQATAHDALKAGFKVIIVRQTVKGVDDVASERALEGLITAGAVVVNTVGDMAKIVQEVHSIPQCTAACPGCLLAKT